MNRFLGRTVHRPGLARCAALAVLALAVALPDPLSAAESKLVVVPPPDSGEIEVVRGQLALRMSGVRDAGSGGV